MGTIITGFTSFDANDRYFGGMTRLCGDDLVPDYKKLVEIIKKHNEAVITQLALGAYYARGRDGRFREVDIDYMTREQIRDMINKFVEAGRRAKEAGFNGVQIHAAHFFFLSRFISPLLTTAQMSMAVPTQTVAGFWLKSCKA